MLHEIDSFVNKFKSLWLSGQEAKLQMDSKNGEAWLNLSLGLKCPPPPSSPSWHPSPRPRSFRNTPSQQRRRNRRQAERETTAAEATCEKDTKVQDEESDQAEEAPHHNVHAEKSDEKAQFKQSEANTARAEQADLPAGDSNENNDIENKSTQNISETTSGNQQLKNWLVCNYCDQSFANEGLLRDHTENDHRSRRIRYRIK